jgi:repressor LexA
MMYASFLNIRSPCIWNFVLCRLFSEFLRDRNNVVAHIEKGVIMKAQHVLCHAKRIRPVIDWNWMRFEDEVKSVEIQVLGTVAAGELIEALPYPQTISIPKDMVGRFQAYALRVEGHSMVDDNIQHGDYIIVEARQTAENGETVVAMVNDEKVTLKKLYIEPDHIRLQPANPKMKPIILHNHEIRILGVVGAVIRKYRYH